MQSDRLPAVEFRHAAATRRYRKLSKGTNPNRTGAARQHRNPRQRKENGGKSAIRSRKARVGFISTRTDNEYFTNSDTHPNPGQSTAELSELVQNLPPNSAPEHQPKLCPPRHHSGTHLSATPSKHHCTSNHTIDTHSNPSQRVKLHATETPTATPRNVFG